MTTASLPSYIDANQLAAYFGISRRSVDRKVKSGEWPSTILPGIVGRRFSPAQVRTIESRAMFIGQQSA